MFSNHFFPHEQFVSTVVSNDFVSAGTGGDALYAGDFKESGGMVGRGIRAGARMQSMHKLMHDRTIGGTIGKVFGEVPGARPSLKLGWGIWGIRQGLLIMRIVVFQQIAIIAI